jgi:TatD DNase family protein
MNAVAVKYPEVCYPAIGLHPSSVKDNFKNELDILYTEIEKHKYYAIGETGIDLYWDKSRIREQCLAFTAQIELALKYGLPVIIHARESFPEIFEILSGYQKNALSGVFHAFTGTHEIAEQVIGFGFKLGIGGILTYNKSTLPEVVKAFGIEHFVLETDCPFLAPVPMRGKRNESSFLYYMAEAVSRIKNIPLSEVAERTSANAIQLFGMNTASHL